PTTGLVAVRLLPAMPLAARRRRVRTTLGAVALQMPELETSEALHIVQCAGWSVASAPRWLACVVGLRSLVARGVSRANSACSGRVRAACDHAHRRSFAARQLVDAEPLLAALMRVDE